MIRASLLSIVLLACGSSEQPPPEPSPEPLPEPVTSYSLHEWGLLTVSEHLVELAAGPGTQAPPPDIGIVVEKPVVYVHASGATRFSLRVHPGAGYELAERWPGSGAPITWDVSASARPCEGAIEYPTSCTSVDGYCEALELARYEAADASCLQVASDRASMLFYRFRAAPDVARRLPVQVSHAGVRATRARTAWRVRSDGSSVRTWRVELTTSETALPDSAAQGAPAAAAWMHHELQRRGLSESERAAFERAWWSKLFGAEMAQEQSEVVEEALPDEDVLERSIEQPVDTLLYLLEDEEIDAIARLEATPAPRNTRRAFVVRQPVTRSPRARAGSLGPDTQTD